MQPQKDEEREATPRAAEDTPVLERAPATAARPKRAAAHAAQKSQEREATPEEVEDTPVQERAVATAARPKRAAAAAAQRAIAATAVKRQRGRRISGASLASVPGAQLAHFIIRLVVNWSVCHTTKSHVTRRFSVCSQHMILLIQWLKAHPPALLMEADASLGSTL